GYERDAAETLLPFDRRQPAVLQPAASGPLLEFRPVPVGRQLPAVRSPRPVVPWMRTLLAALPLLLLLLAAAWLLRSMMPADPDLALATREGPAAPIGRG